MLLAQTIIKHTKGAGTALILVFCLRPLALLSLLETTLDSQALFWFYKAPFIISSGTFGSITRTALLFWEGYGVATGYGCMIICDCSDGLVGAKDTSHEINKTYQSGQSHSHNQSPLYVIATLSRYLYFNVPKMAQLRFFRTILYCGRDSQISVEMHRTRTFERPFYRLSCRGKQSLCFSDCYIRKLTRKIIWDS